MNAVVLVYVVLLGLNIYNFILWPHFFPAILIALCLFMIWVHWHGAVHELDLAKRWLRRLW